MENEIELRGEGVPEKEPETIGEALKKYYEDELSQATGLSNVKMLTPRQAELDRVMTQHCMAFN